MTFKASGDVEMMEWIWESLDKSPDADHITYVVDDIDALWHMGFVDTEATPLEKWRAAFDRHKKTNGDYILSKSEFLEKNKYRYTGEVHIPFDAMRINEGKYTEKGLNQLTESSILPSVSLSRSQLDRFMIDLKNEFRDSADGLITIAKEAKQKIHELILNNPSPLRRLELIYENMFANIDTVHNKPDLPTIPDMPQATPSELAEIQKSTFSTLPSSQAQKSAESLKKIAKNRESDSPSDKGSVELKTIKRNPKGFRS